MRLAHRDWPENLRISAALPEWDIALEIQDEWRAAVIEECAREIERLTAHLSEKEKAELAQAFYDFLMG